MTTRVATNVAELLRRHADLSEPTVVHLQRLVATWGTLSDLCFADLLLFVPIAGEGGEGRSGSFVVVGQVRPTTNATLHLEDLVGRVRTETERPLVGRSWRLGSVVDGEVAIPSRNEQGRVVCIPVRFKGDMVAILTRESALSVGRRPGQLERVYMEVFDRLARMVSNGEYPYPMDEVVTTETPRVGDGVLVLDASMRVDYASPNAVNAFHRMGISSGLAGVRLDEVGFDDSAVAHAYDQALPTTEEVTSGPEVAVVIRCMPLLDHGSVTGAIVLMRDVSELRRRDRLLLSKDAAIRELHHRVKNNLQTISSLLRLQARRLPPGEGRHALDESERRVRSIALVHEILSRDTRDEVDFNQILPSLVRLAEDLGPEGRVRFGYSGEAGRLHGSVATPLAVVVTELLQNAAEHAFPHPDHASPTELPDAEEGEEGEPAQVDVLLERQGRELRLSVRDNGKGLPPGFSVEDTSSLGLSIVRGLVRSQLGGHIDMHTDGGTVVDVVIPVDPLPGELPGL